MTRVSVLHAITPGDGSIGQDITRNAKTIHSIPMRIDYQHRTEIPGEVVIFTDEFEKISLERSKACESLFANPRNAPPGSLRQLDSKITASRCLVFLPYRLGKNEIDLPLLSDKMEFIYGLGFHKPPLHA